MKKNTLKALQSARRDYRAAQFAARDPGADIITRMAVALSRNIVRRRLDEERATRKNARLQALADTYNSSMAGNHGVCAILSKASDPAWYRVQAMEKLMYARMNVMALRRMKIDPRNYVRRAIEEIRELRAKSQKHRLQLQAEVLNKVLVLG